MKIGDLVKFISSMHMPGCLGIVVAYNGEAFDVQWIDKFSRGSSDPEISTELPEFVEVISEAR